MDIASKIKFIERKKIQDSRGWFLKVINGLEENLPNHTGEVYLTNATPGESKGGHYHPKANEWFTLITGTCEVKLVDILTGEKLTIQLSDDEPRTLYVPNHIAHIFTNYSKNEFILLAYSDELYDPKDTIMFNEF